MMTTGKYRERVLCIQLRYQHIEHIQQQHIKLLVAQWEKTGASGNAENFGRLKRGALFFILLSFIFAPFGARN